MKLQELTETIVFQNVDRAPRTFIPYISKMADRVKDIGIYDSSKIYGHDTVFIRFGRTASLPTQKNTIYVGNEYYNKAEQYDILGDRVPTIVTFEDTIDVFGKEFIAKHKEGWKQQGQLINQYPSEDTNDYIYQPLVEVHKEYRVVTYYMNGKYHVSGIYKKMGSNVSISSISTTSALGRELSKLAIKSTSLLGYGVGGVDLGIVSGNDDVIRKVNESVLGKLTSLAGKAIGSLDTLSELGYEKFMVVFEVNSMPSMSNPMIIQDFMDSARKNVR